MPKNLKRGHLGSFNVFYKPKTSKKCKGDPLVSPVLLEALKNLWFSARIERLGRRWKMNKYER